MVVGVVRGSGWSWGRVGVWMVLRGSMGPGHPWGKHRGLGILGDGLGLLLSLGAVLGSGHPLVWQGGVWAYGHPWGAAWGVKATLGTAWGSHGGMGFLGSPTLPPAPGCQEERWGGDGVSPDSWVLSPALGGGPSCPEVFSPTPRMSTAPPCAPLTPLGRTARGAAPASMPSPAPPSTAPASARKVGAHQGGGLSPHPHPHAHPAVPSFRRLART